MQSVCLHSLKSLTITWIVMLQLQKSCFVCGDFNFHFEDDTNGNICKLRDLLFSLNLCQHVKMATHTHGHVLDIVITRVSEKAEGLVQCLDTDGAVLSDHAPILFSIPYRKPAPKQNQVTFRKITYIGMTVFLQDIQQSTLCTSPSEDITELAVQYQTMLTAILDTNAPAQTKTITIKPQPLWYTETIREAKRPKRVRSTGGGQHS